VLVNDVWGGDDLVEWGKRLWETKLVADPGVARWNGRVVASWDLGDV
jgi:hypothetical protein